MPRKLIASMLVCGALAALQAHAELSTNEPVTLQWDYPEEVSADLTFTVYHSESLQLPLNQWQVLTNVPGSTFCVTLTVQPGCHFFYVTARNWWGESDPSNVASTPAPPRSGTLTIRRGK